jgi:nucleotide-binding universal stress UspA family protein
MPTPKKILVPIDFSPASLKAVRYATELAACLPEAEIVVMHSIEPMVFPVKPPRGTETPDHAGWRREIQDKLDDLAKKIRSSGKLPVKAVLRTGRSFQEIARAAESTKADLIVMGSAGYAGGDYSQLGSTAERVARKAPCAVLLVRDGRVETR